MAGEDFLKFNNGKKFSFSNFKEIKEADLKNADDETKRLFNIFAGDDHVLQASEAQSLWDKLKTSATTNKNGDNSVLDDEEILKFLDSDSDIKAFSTETNFSINTLTDLVSQIFATPKNNSSQNPQIETKEYTPEEIEDISVQTLSDDADNAGKLYDKQNSQQGSVSNFVNATKENFETEFASSKVGRYIRKEKLCAELLKRSKSQEGLSQKEYLEAKIDFVMSLIQDLEKYSLRTEITQGAINITLRSLTRGVVGYNKTENSQELEAKGVELETLKAILARLKPEEINLMIDQLLSINENPETPSEYNLSFGGKNNPAKPQTVSRNSADSLNMKFSPLEYEAQAEEGSLASLNQAEAYKKMSFEETFEKERKITYNSEAVMDYTQKDSYMKFLLGIHNRREQVAELLNDALSIKQARTYGEQVQGDIQNSARGLVVNLTKALKIVCGDDITKIQELIDSIYPNTNRKPKVITDNNGKFVSLSFGIEGKENNLQITSEQGLQTYLPNPDMKINNLTINSMLNLAEKLQSNINSTYEQALNGKTIEEYSNEVKQAYANAYGNGDAQKIVNEYIKSQQEGVGYVKIGTSTIGMAVMVAGQLIPVGGQVAAAMMFGGLASATLGSSAVTATELLTKEGKITQEEWRALGEEVATSLALTVSGMKIGKLSEGVYLAIAKHCPKLVALAAEIGSDATMSLVADLAITGQIDLSGEGIAQLQGVLVGILHAKGNFKVYLDKHAQSAPKQNIEENTRTNSESNLSKTTQETRQVETENNTPKQQSQQSFAENTHAGILSARLDNAKNIDEILSIKKHIEELSDSPDKSVLIEKYLNTILKLGSENETKLITKILDNPELKNNPIILELLEVVLKKKPVYIQGAPYNFFGSILKKTGLDKPLMSMQNKQQIKENDLITTKQLEILDIFVSNPILYRNKQISDLILKQINYCYSTDSANFMKEGLNLYINTKEFQETPIIQENLDILFRNVSPDKKIKFLNFIKNNPDLNKSDINSFVHTLSDTDDIDTILEIWSKDNNLKTLLFCMGDSPEVRNARLYFLKKYGDISLASIHIENYEFLMKLSENDIPADFLKKYIGVLNENNLQTIQKLDKKGNLSEEDITKVSRWITKLNKEFIESLIEQNDISMQNISHIACSTTNNKMCLQLAKELLEIPDFPKEQIYSVLIYANKDNLSKIRELCHNKGIQRVSRIGDIINYINNLNKDFILKLCNDPELEDRDIILLASWSRDQQSFNLIKKMYESNDIDKKYLTTFAEQIRENNIEYLEKLYFNKNISKKLLAKISISLSYLNESNAQFTEYLLLNYQKLGIFEEQIDILIRQNEVFDLNILSQLNKMLGKETVLKLDANALFVCIHNFDLIGKNSLNDLTKTEKRNLLNTLLVNKSSIESSTMQQLKDILPLLPQNTEGYVRSINVIKNSLNMEISNKLSVDEQNSFNTSLNEFSTLLKEAGNIDDIHLSHSHEEFAARISSILKDLPQEEQLRIQNMFGFKIINGKLTGYPNTKNSTENITNREIVNKVQKEVETYLNNQIIVENNPQLGNVLNSMIKKCPELLNQIDGSSDFKQVLQQLQTTLSKKEFNNLSNDDKQIVILAHLLGNTDKHLNTRADAANEGYFISQKLGFSNEMSQKLYSIIEMLNAPDEFMATSKKISVRNYRGTIIEGQEREDIFDLLAFKLKEGNLFELTKMVYDSNYPKGFTDRFNNILSRRIREIKANDFSLLQTASSTYRQLAKQTSVLSNNKVYSVNVVNAEDIPNFYALAHTPEAGFASGGTRDANFANFQLFEMVGDDKVICTGYITAQKAGLVRNFHHGFIFEVPNDKQYVGYGTDIFSLGKNIPDMLVEYFR